MINQNIQSILFSILTIAVTVYLIVGVFLYIKQRDFIYFPTLSIGDNNQEEFHINSQIIKTTIINQGKKDAIIYFGGNAEIVDYNINQFSKTFEEHTIYLVKYRGYSGSSGKPTEKGLYNDALAIYDKINLKYKTVSIIGRSLGSGVATFVASKRDIYKLALITPFDSVESVAQKRFPLYPVFIILKDKYNSIGRVDDINASTLIIIAQNDTIIEYANSEALVDKFPSSQISVETIEDATHNNIINYDKYYTLLKDFLR